MESPRALELPPTSAGGGDLRGQAGNAGGHDFRACRFRSGPWGTDLGARRRRWGEVLARHLLDDAVDRLAVERLVLEQLLRHLVEHRAIALEQLLGALVAVLHDALHLAVDLLRGLLAVVGPLREVAPEEDRFFAGAES